MYLWALTKSAISCLSANKGRLIFGVSSISLGIAILIAAMVIYESQKVFLKREMGKVGANLMNVFADKLPHNTSDKDVVMIKRCQGILNIAYSTGGGEKQVQYFNKTKEAWVIGWSPEIKKMINLSLKQGRFFTQQEVDARSNVGVIGCELASHLFGKRNPAGETIFIMVKGEKVPIKIIGVLEEIGFFQYQMALVGNNGIILSPTYIRDKILAKSWKEILHHIMVQAVNASQVKKVASQIKKAFILHRNFSAFIVTQDDFINYEYNLLKRTTLIGLCIALVFLIVGGIGIMNMMLKSVLERTKEIGIRKAVGAKKKDILIQFLIEGCIIGLFGCMIGIIIGMVGVHFILGFMPDELIKGGEIIISLKPILISAGVCFGICLLFGLYPAYRAASLPPIEALRYE